MNGESRPSFVFAVIRAAVLLSLAWTTAPQLLRLAREATALAPLSRAERRARVNGAVVESVQQIKRRLRPDQPVALLGDSGFTIFANYYGYPWLSRDLGTLDMYRAAARDPRRPETIVVVDAAGARFATYAALRDARLRSGPVVHGPSLKPLPRTFVIPLAGSVDGFPPDTFVTEAEFANDAAQPVRVRITLFPDGKIGTVAIPPHGSVVYYDLVYQLFQKMDVRWALVESDGESDGESNGKGEGGSGSPLRGGVWFVNRGRREAVPLPFVGTWTTGALTCPAAKCRVWLLNRLDRDVTVTVDDHPVSLPPHGMTSASFRGTTHVASHGDAFAFATTKEPPTLFAWPEGVRP